MISVIKLRKSHPNMQRPFKVPFYPITPITALIIAFIAMVSMTIYNLELALIFLTIVLGSFGVYKIVNSK